MESAKLIDILPTLSFLSGMTANDLKRVLVDDDGDVEIIKGVYWIMAGEVIKIGYTGNLYKRLCQLQTGTHEEVTIVNVFHDYDKRLERAFHELFRNQHVRGEWFKNDGALAAWVDCCQLVTCTRKRLMEAIE